VVAGGTFGGPKCAANTIPDLGAAADFGVLGLSNASYAIQGSIVVGDVGIAAGGAASNSGAVFGNATESSSGQFTNSGYLSGSISVDPTTMASANSAARTAASVAAGDTPTQALGAVNSSTTVTGNGGLNVIRITSLNLNNASLTLNGTASDIFVIQVSGNFTMTGSGRIVLGTNVSASQVLIVFTSNNTGVTIGPSNNNNPTINGTLLSASTSTNWNITGGIFNGEIITATTPSHAGTLNLSGAILSATPFRPIPEPSSVVLAGIASLWLASLARWKRKGAPGRTAEVLTS
jgi:hypothetical protein